MGESAGPFVLYPPGKQAVHFTGYMRVERESCDRFLRLDFFGHLPNGIETVQAMVTYSEKHECYRMWSFASSHEEPVLMHGEFNGDSLVFLSDPTDMASGIEKMRCTFTPIADGVVEYLVEFWTIEGHVPYVRGRLLDSTVPLV